MRAELYRPAPEEGAPGTVVAVATWADDRATIEVLDPAVEGLDGIVRATPVVVDDPSLRALGTRGEVLLQPGDLRWFAAAARTRAAALGLSVRFVTDAGPGGWDPASQYRPFEEQVERLARERS